MAVPARRTSKTAKRLRRSHEALSAIGLTACKNCGAQIKPHTVCPECGFYKGKQVISVKNKEN